MRADLIGWLGGGLLVAGLAFHLWSNVSLARGEVRAGQASSALVVEGPFRFVRNPIYLAGTPLLLGACFLYSTLSSADLAAARRSDIVDDRHVANMMMHRTPQANRLGHDRRVARGGTDGSGR